MSAKSNVVAIAKPSDPADALRAGRERLVARISEAEHKLAKLALAQKDEEAIFGEIARLGEKEIEQVKLWVASGCEGAQPQPDAKARRELTERMGRAVDATKAARAVAAEVEQDAHPLRKRLAEIDSEIRALRIAEFENQFGDAVAEFAALASKMHLALTTIRSAPIALIDVGRREFDRGDESFARACYAAVARMRNQKLPDVEPSEVEILHAIAHLTGTIISGGEVRLDAAIDPAPALPPAALLAAAAARNQAANQLMVPDGKL